MTKLYTRNLMLLRKLEINSLTRLMWKTLQRIPMVSARCFHLSGNDFAPVNQAADNGFTKRDLIDQEWNDEMAEGIYDAMLRFGRNVAGVSRFRFRVLLIGSASRVVSIREISLEFDRLRRFCSSPRRLI